MKQAGLSEFRLVFQFSGKDREPGIPVSPADLQQSGHHFAGECPPVTATFPGQNQVNLLCLAKSVDSRFMQENWIPETSRE